MKKMARSQRLKVVRMSWCLDRYDGRSEVYSWRGAPAIWRDVAILYDYRRMEFLMLAHRLCICRLISQEMPLVSRDIKSLSSRKEDNWGDFYPFRDQFWRPYYRVIFVTIITVIQTR
jgi:hypothetical protein